MTLAPDIDLLFCVLAPFLAAVAAPVLCRIFEAWTAALLALVPAAVCIYLCSLIPQIAAGEPIVRSMPWIPALGLDLSFALDGLSLTFALLISGIGVLVLVYSGSYMADHPQRGRFLAFLMAFMGAMLGLVLANNTVALYAFWELTTVTSFLLIGFDHARPAARRAAIQALVVTNIGGLALLIGGVALRLALGTWDLGTLKGLGGAVQVSPVYPLLLAAFLVAAFTKSAQFPFHFWLPAAMQAPTPVSAYLHSATMVQAGIYLLARMTPILGGTPQWTAWLIGAGGVTLAWGALSALRQTDLKQILAHSTVASLGMLVLLIGIGTETAAAAAIVYFVAHALYKAALFLVAGLLESETGTREVTALGGLRDRMALSFIAALLATASLVGLPPTLGFFAKEEGLVAVFALDWSSVLLLILIIAAHAALAAVAVLVAVKPFAGVLLATPKVPREGPSAQLLGPLVLAGLGIAGGWMVVWFAWAVTGPATAAILGHPIDAGHFAELNIFNPVLLLTILTWAVAAGLYWKLDRVRSELRRYAARIGWTFEAGFDLLMFGLIRLAGAVTRTLQHGRLELYLVTIFSLLAIALLLPPLLRGSWPQPPSVPGLTLYEWGAIILAALGLLAVVLARTRLFAIIALGVQGLALALIFMLFGAPDLSLTQFMVEILSVVILALVMTRLRLDDRDPRPFENLLRDGGLALLCGAGMALVLLRVIQQPFDDRLGTFFTETSAVLAHGRNIVNVILVDFRGLDTLGEISVIMAAGIAVLTLIHRGGGTRQLPPAAPRRPRRAGQGRSS